MWDMRTQIECLVFNAVSDFNNKLLGGKKENLFSRTNIEWTLGGWLLSFLVQRLIEELEHKVNNQELQHKVNNRTKKTILE
jgi:hypothetical protein